MANKLTRYQVMKAIVEGNIDLLVTEEAQTVAQKYCDSVDKQKSKPKGKTQARIQNEGYARTMFELMQKHNKPVTATWVTNRVQYVTSSQKATRVAEVAQELGYIEIVRNQIGTFYILPGFCTDEIDWKKILDTK